MKDNDYTQMALNMLGTIEVKQLDRGVYYMPSVGKCGLHYQVSKGRDRA